MCSACLPCGLRVVLVNSELLVTMRKSAIRDITRSAELEEDSFKLLDLLSIVICDAAHGVGPRSGG